MNDFHFLRPALLWLLIIPVVYITGRLLIRYKQNRVGCIVPEMRPYLANAANGYKELLFRLLPALGLAVGILALAGPVWEKLAVKQPGQQSISLVVHLPENCSKNDMSQMKIAIYHLLNSLRYEHISLSVQSGSTHLLIPYTNDYRLVRTYTEFLSPDIMPARGDNMEEIAKVAVPPKATSFHTTLYITPEMSAEKTKRWKRLKLPSGHQAVLTTRRSDGTDSSGIIHIGVNNEGVDAMLAELRQKADEKIREAALQDSTQWKDRSYLLCIPATLLLLPLFFRYKKSLFFLTAVLSLSSCTYTGRMWNEAQVNFFLIKEDTLQAIRTSKDPFRRGMLWSAQQKYEEAAREFAQDSTCEALYNRGLSVYRRGYLLESLSLLKEVEKRKPEWTFVSADIEVIEKMISASVNKSSTQEDRKGEDSFDSFEKDPDEKKNGNEAELRADKLMNLKPDEMNYRGGKALERSEVLFRQIENDPKEFIKRRLEYEYTHKEQ